MFDVEKIRQDFPILAQSIQGKRNTYLDTAASAQKPLCVIERMKQAYLEQYANVHRGSYYLSETATENYEDARKTVARFVNALKPEEIIFTRNATEGINLVASTYGIENIKAGDEILLSRAEHHANLVPWQQLAFHTGAVLKYCDLLPNGGFSEESFISQLSNKTKIVAITAMSNVLGTIFPIKKVCKIAHTFGAKVLIDACQYVAHKKIDVVDCDCDFLVFSGHKLYGPTGIGVLYGKLSLLNNMPPYQFGGDMIEHVTYDKSTFSKAPARFEAGTPAIVQAIGLGAAIQYLQQFSYEEIITHEQNLSDYMTQQLHEIDGLKIVGTTKDKGAVFSFSIKDIHPQDLSFILGKEGIAVRTGHFCAEPLVSSLGYTSLTRASLGIYSNKEDVDELIKAIKKAKSFLS